MNRYLKALKGSNKILLLLPATLLLQACSDSDSLSPEEQALADAQAAAAAPVEALFNTDGSQPVIPFPNTLFFADSEDSTINIPVEDPTDLSDPLVGINQLDGFSTINPIRTPVSLEFDPDTVEIGTSVFVVEVAANIASGFVTTGVISDVGPDSIVAFSEPNNLVLQPLTPLTPGSTYLVLLTDGLVGTNGEPFVRSDAYESLAAATVSEDPEVAELQQVIQSHLVVADSVGVPRDTVGLSFTFNTQSTRETLGALQNVTIPQPLLISETAITTAATGGTGSANIWTGTLDVPYYLNAVGENGAVSEDDAPDENGAADAPDEDDADTDTDTDTDADADADGSPDEDDAADEPNEDDAPAENPAVEAALNSFWTGEGGSFLTASNPLPVTTGNSNPNGTESIPVLLSVPNETSAFGGEMPPFGWPVAIFQHDVNQDRTDLLAIADAMADVGFAVIGIDLPLHGITSDNAPENLLTASAAAFPGDSRERHFDIDLVNASDPFSSLPDGVIDDSGTHFLNLSNLPNLRDNMRQAVADLLVLSTSISGVQNPDPAGSPIMFDISQKAFIGHSLGASVGSVFLSYDTTISSATLANPGSGIAQLLAASAEFGPEITADLAATEIVSSTPEFDEFLLATQTIIDSADPANHLGELAITGTPIHIIQVNNDQVVPNSVSGAPLSGTEPMAALLGLPTVTGNTTGGGIVRFLVGSNSSFVDSTSNPAATAEMHNQAATFASTASTGFELPIVDSGLIDILGPVIPEVEPEVDPAADPEVTPETDPTVTPVTDPAVTPATDPAVTPATDPAVTPVTDPAVTPVTDPAVTPVTDPAVTPVTDPAVTPVTDPAVTPVTDPAVTPVTDPAVTPVTDPAVTPVTDPAVTPVTDPAVNPVTDPAINPVTDPGMIPETDPEVTPEILIDGPI